MKNVKALVYDSLRVGVLTHAGFHTFTNPSDRFIVGYKVGGYLLGFEVAELMLAGQEN